MMKNSENKEERKELDRYERIAERADKEIDRVYRIYRLLVFVLGVIIVAGLTIATILIGNSIGNLEHRVNRRIDEEFKTEKIQKLIEEKAKEYTEKAVQEYIAAKINESITPFKKKMENALKEAQNRLEIIDDIVSVEIVANLAQFGSIQNYTKLKEMSESKTFANTIAKAKLIEIEKNLQKYRQSPVLTLKKLQQTKKNGTVVPLEDLSLDEVVNIMQRPITTDEQRHNCMTYIKTKPKEQVLKKAIGVLETSESLPTRAAFCGVLSEISDEKADFLDFEGWIEICQKQLEEK